MVALRNTEPVLQTWKPLGCLRCDMSLLLFLALTLLPVTSLPLSFSLSSFRPIFWHFRRCSSHASSSPLPPSTTSITALYQERTSLCLKLMYFVELTLMRLYHLEVAKWYWAERLCLKRKAHRETLFGRHRAEARGGNSPLDLNFLTTLKQDEAKKPETGWRLQFFFLCV